MRLRDAGAVLLSTVLAGCRVMMLAYPAREPIGGPGYRDVLGQTDRRRDGQKLPRDRHQWGRLEPNWRNTQDMTVERQMRAVARIWQPIRASESASDPERSREILMLARDELQRLLECIGVEAAEACEWTQFDAARRLASKPVGCVWPRSRRGAVRGVRNNLKVLLVRIDRESLPAELSAARACELEDLFDTVWHCERDWSFDDRLDRAVAFESRRSFGT